MKIDYLELPECTPMWENSVPKCSKNCSALSIVNTCTFLSHFVGRTEICIPMVQHMKHVIDKFQKEDQETEDMIQGLKKGGGAHG